MKSTKLVTFVNLLIMVAVGGSLFAAERRESSPRSESTVIVAPPTELTTLPSVSSEPVLTRSVSPSAASTTADGVSLWQVFSGGATSGSSGQTVLMATLGQPLIGIKQSGGVSLSQGFWAGGVLGPQSCCTGWIGDADGNGEDVPNLGDVSVMIDALFISGAELWCLAEADVNQSGGYSPEIGDISIVDITTLIDYLFISGPPLGLPDCL